MSDSEGSWDVIRLHREAAKCEATGRLSEAIRLCSQAVALATKMKDLHPDDFEAQLIYMQSVEQLGRLYGNAGDLERMDALFDESARVRAQLKSDS
jgi:hypothetical protein